MMPPSAWRPRLAELRPYQPWARYYEFRAAEMAVVAALCPLPRGGRLLELGCGNAFHSYLLSDSFDECVATDLHTPDARTHTLGLASARALARVLGFERLRLVAASAEALPLPDASVDFVFSSNVLEHVPDRRRAVAEIFRVLRPGGRCLTIVPAAMERVYNLPVSYVAVLHSMARGLRSHLRGAQGPAPGKPTLAVAAGNGAASGGGLAGKVRGFMARHYPGFPFPKPHGEYASSTEEFLAHRPAAWEALLRTAPFQIERTFTTILAPHNLGMAISFGAAYWVARAGAPLTRLLGARQPFKALGTSYAVLMSRPREAGA